MKRELQWIASGQIGGTAQGGSSTYRSKTTASRLPLWFLSAATAALLAAVLVLFPGWNAHRSESSPEAVQLSLALPPQTTFSSPPASVAAPEIAISPDGRQIAFIAEAPRGRPGLWVRSLGASEAQLLRGTEDALYPFWSPDSRAIGFFAQGKLKTIEISGGPPRTLIDSALDARGSAVIALAGGKTPAPILEKLAQQKIDWKRVTIIPTDERIVAMLTKLCR